MPWRCGYRTVGRVADPFPPFAFWKQASNSPCPCLVGEGDVTVNMADTSSVPVSIAEPPVPSRASGERVTPHNTHTHRSQLR